jgi:ABC-2 type transport system permease protein
MKYHLEQLWQQRFVPFVRETIYYAQYIARGGLMLTIILLALAGIFYYPQIIEMIPEGFPVGLLMALFLSVFLARGQHRTLLHEADLVFLTPQEERMPTYFGSSFRYNFFLQGAVVLILLVALAPLFVHRVAYEGQPIYLYFLLPIILKGWNLHISWHIHRLVRPAPRGLHAIVRYLFHFMLLYWFFHLASLWWLALCALLVLLFYILQHHIIKHHRFNWLHLREMEDRLSNRFFRFAAQFVDVPIANRHVKGQRWLSGLAELLPFKHDNTYQYLMIKSFLRSYGLLGIYLRLTVIGLLLISFVDIMWLQAVVFIMFLIITRLQLKILLVHHKEQFWYRLHPAEPNRLKLAHAWLVNRLLGMQMAMFIIPIAIQMFW